MVNVFYIAPFKSDEKFLKKLAIIEAISFNYGLNLMRGVIENETFNIDKTLKLFKKADFFIADLSLERPSCYFELGFAQALGKKVFLIAEKNTDIHQTMGRNEVMFFEDIDDYKKVIIQILEQNSI